MTELRRLGRVNENPTSDGVGGGITIKPGKVSDLINPSMDQVELYDPNVSYEKGQFVLVKDGRSFVIYKSTESTTGEFNPDSWKKYVLGEELDDIRSSVNKSNDELMTEIVKGSGASKFKTSGLLDSEQTTTKQTIYDYNPFLGLKEMGYDPYNGVLINGSVVTVDTNQTIDLGPSPITDIEYDLIFIEAYRVEVEGVDVMKHRVRSFALTSHEYNRGQSENSFFLGLGSTRTRTIQPQGANDQPINELVSIDKSSNAYRYGTFLSGAERTTAPLGQNIELDDTGLWIAGDGSEESKLALGTTDGYSYAIPVSIVKRRNTTDGSRINSNGASDYISYIIDENMGIDSEGNHELRLSNDIVPYEPESGTMFSIDGSLVKYIGVNTDGNFTFEPWVMQEPNFETGGKLETITTSPFKQYSNIVESTDIISIQRTLTTGLSQYNELLDSTFNKFMRGELMNADETRVVDVFEEQSFKTIDEGNLIPVVHSNGKELVNIIGELMKYDYISEVLRWDMVSYESRDLTNPEWYVFEISGSYGFTEKYNGVDLLRIPVEFNTFNKDTRFLILAEFDNEADDSLILTLDEYSDRFVDEHINFNENGINYKGFVLGKGGNLGTGITVEFNSRFTEDMTVKFKYRNLRMYAINDDVVITPESVVNDFPYVLNKPKSIQNILEHSGDIRVKKITENVINVKATGISDDGSEEVAVIGSWDYTGIKPLINMQIIPNIPDHPYIEIAIISHYEYVSGGSVTTDTDRQTIGFIEFFNNVAKPTRLYPKNLYHGNDIVRQELVIIGDLGSFDVNITELRVSSMFANTTEFMNCPYGVWDVASESDVLTNIHSLTIDDAQRKIWSHGSSSSSVVRTISPIVVENPKDIVISNQLETSVFNTDDVIEIKSRNIIAPMYDDVSLNSSRVISVSGNIVTVSNVQDLNVGESVNIINPITMNTAISNVKVVSVDESTNAVVFDTEQKILPEYLVMETTVTPLVPTLDDFVEASWTDINTKNPSIKLNNLIPDVPVKLPDTSVYTGVFGPKLTDINKVIDGEGAITDTDWVMVKSKKSSTIALRNDGTIWSWGDNQYGQLGLGHKINQTIPTRIGSDTDWVYVEVGDTTMFAIKNDGTLWAWGVNQYGQLGIGSTTMKDTPTQVGVDTDWSSVYATWASTAGLKEDGTLFTWGYGQGGALGQGDKENSQSPKQLGLSGEWSSVAMGYNHMAAIKKDGSLWTWGTNLYGQLGIGTTTESVVPVQVGTDIDWKSVHAYYCNIATKTDNRTYMWGNADNELINTRDFIVKEPILIGTYDWTDISVNIGHIVTIDSEGSMWAWGENASHLLGFSNTPPHKTPFKIGTDADWLNCSASQNGTFSIKKDGTIWSSGDNTKGQLGDGSNKSAGYLQMINNYKYKNGTLVRLDAGGHHSAAIKRDGTLWTWGYNEHGQLGNGIYSMLYNHTPDQVGVDADWNVIALGDFHSLALKLDGTLWSWGANSNGQLGNGGSISSSIPVQVGTDKWKFISAHSNISVGIKMDGTLWHWGKTISGTGTIVLRPTQVATDNDWKHISVGNGFALGIKYDGTLWACGVNANGQLGNVTRNPSPVPIQIGTDNTWTDVATGNANTVACKRDGTLWSWGSNSNGQVGNGNTTDRTSPLRIGTDTNWSKVSTKGNSVIAIKTDGSIWVWGDNTYKQLGQGSSVSNVLTPTKIQFNEFVKHSIIFSDAVMGIGHSFAIAVDGTIVCTGLNVNGQLGRGDTYETSSFIKMTNAMDWAIPSETFINLDKSGDVKFIAVHEKTTAIIRKNGTLWMCGSNSNGQFGIGTSSFNEYNFIQIGTSNDWKHVTLGASHMIATKHDGTVWGSGLNENGQLGSDYNYTTHTLLRLKDLDKLVMIKSQYDTNLGIDVDNNLWGWGINSSSQLGMVNTATSKPVLLGKKVRDFAIGFDHTAIIDTTGALWTCGSNSNGQLGTGDVVDHESYFKISNETNWVKVYATTDGTFAINSEGKLFGTGGNIYNLIDSSTNVTINSLTMIDLGGKSANYLSVGTSTIVCVCTDGTILSWGNNSYGQTMHPSDSGVIIEGPQTPTIVNNKTVSGVFVGNEHVVVSTINNELLAMGSNYGGQLGIGTGQPEGSSSKLMRVYTGMSGWLKVASCGNYSIGIKKDNSLWAWGDNSSGQLGTGNTVNVKKPTRVGVLADWLDISLGKTHAVGVKMDGTLWAWGSNANNQLGNPSLTSSTRPEKITTDTNWISVEAGYNHTVAKKSDGSIWSWGYNNDGQLGLGDITARTIPTRIGTSSSWYSIHVGGDHNFAMMNNGTLHSWGKNSDGQLGNGTTIGRLSPSVADFSELYGGVKKMTLGDTFTIAIDHSGRAWAWGNGADGRLGNNSLTDKLVPVQIGESSEWYAIESGENHSIGLMNNGTMWAWGENSKGELGGSKSTGYFAVPNEVDTSSNWEIISSGLSHTAIIKSDGSLWTTGSNEHGQLGNDSTSNQNRLLEVYNAADEPMDNYSITRNWKELSVGGTHTLALKSDGTMWAWGYNYRGRLGLGDGNQRNLPHRIGKSNQWNTVSAGYGHSAAINKDGTLWMWGNNGQGQLGIPSVGLYSNTPVQVGADNDWAVVSCGYNATLAIKKSGTLWFWGNSSQVTPIQIGASTDWNRISASRNHFLAINTSNKLYTWGTGAYGQLGLGETTEATTPTLVGSKSWKKVVSANYHTMGLTTSGEIWVWGRNNSGQLGTGNYSDIKTPVQIESSSTWIDISSGHNHSGALKQDGTLYTWGRASYGQLGFVSRVDVMVPTEVEMDRPVSAIQTGENTTTVVDETGIAYATGRNDLGGLGIGVSAQSNNFKMVGVGNIVTSYGVDHIAIIKGDGTLWTSGSNNKGALGIGSLVDGVENPVQVGRDSDWSKVSCGQSFTLAIKTNGTLWAWGSNVKGQLGDGTYEDRYTPTLISTEFWENVFCSRNGGSSAAYRNRNVYTWGEIIDSNVPVFIDSDFSLYLSKIEMYPKSMIILDSTRIVGTFGSSVGGNLGRETKVFKEVIDSSEHTILIKQDGTMWAWGVNDKYQISDSFSTDDIEFPAHIRSTDTWKHVSTGVGFTIAIKEDGTMWSWGLNDTGQLGRTGNNGTYGQIGTSSNWLKVEAGDRHAVAIKEDGTMWSWGNNDYAQLGLNGMSLYEPIEMYADLGKTWTDASAGSKHTISLTSDGFIYTSGYGEMGQLGAYSTAFSGTAVQASQYAMWASVYARGNHTCAISTDGTLHMWGDNTHGQLGSDPATYPIITSPTSVLYGLNVKSVALGESKTIIIDIDGQIHTWGLGVVTDGHITYTPSKLEGSSWSSITVGRSNSYGIDTNGVVYKWNSPREGQFGENIGTVYAKIMQVHNIPEMDDILVTDSATYLLNSDTGDIYRSGRLAGSTFEKVDHSMTSPNKLFGSKSVVYVSTDEGIFKHPVNMFQTTLTSTLVELEDGLIKDPIVMTPKDTVLIFDSVGNMWREGSSKYFKENTAPKFAMTRILENVAKLSVGDTAISYIDTEGYMWSVGVNDIGQLGDGTTEDKTVPVRLGDETDNLWTSIKSGNGHSIALKQDGTLWGWGYNSTGAIGDGTTSHRKSPKQIGTDTNWVFADALESGTVAMKSDGTIWAWGYNANGEVGNNTKTETHEPTMVGTDTDWVKVSAGANHVIALKSNGTVWVWGDNAFGQLGDGTKVDKWVPTRITLPRKAIYIAAGGRNSSVILDTNTLWSAGINKFGQIGNGTTTNVLTFEQINGDTDWKEVSHGHHHTVAKKLNNSIWTYGASNHGRLGLDDSEHKYTPTLLTTRRVIKAEVESNATYLIDHSNNVWFSGTAVVLPSLDTGWKVIEGEVVDVSVPITKPFNVEYRELHAPGAGLSRNVKNIDSVRVNGDMYTNTRYTELSMDVLPENIYSTDGSIATPTADMTYNIATGDNIEIPAYINHVFGERVLNTSVKEAYKMVPNINIAFKVIAHGGDGVVYAGANAYEVTDGIEQTIISDYYWTWNYADSIENTYVYDERPTGVDSVHIRFEGEGITNIDVIDPVIIYGFECYTGTPYLPISHKIEYPTSNQVINMGGVGLKTNSKIELIRFEGYTDPIKLKHIEYTHLNSGEPISLNYNINSLKSTSKILMTLDLKERLNAPVSKLVDMVDYITISSDAHVWQNDVPYEMSMSVLNNDTSYYDNIGVDSDGNYRIPINAEAPYVNLDGSIVVAYNVVGLYGTVIQGTSITLRMEDISITLSKDYSYPRINGLSISDNGEVELLFPPVGYNGVFDTIEVFYKSNPKLQPIINTGDMIILAESDDVLVTDEGDAIYIESEPSERSPYANPLSHFDYDFSDLIGYMGFDGISFSGDSSKTNIDSKVRIINGVLEGASQQHAVKTYETAVAAITRSLVYYDGAVCMLLTVVKSLDGVIDTQNGYTTRYIVPVEGNIHIPEPKSVTRRTIRYTN